MLINRIIQETIGRVVAVRLVDVFSNDASGTVKIK
jgi:hypothetical protein